MAKVCIDLGLGTVRCTACGKGGEPELANPCPYCGCRFTKVEYKRGFVRKTTKLTYGRDVFTINDLELEKRKAVDYIWDREAVNVARKAIAEAPGKELDLITALDIAKKAFYLERGVVLK